LLRAHPFPSLPIGSLGALSLRVAMIGYRAIDSHPPNMHICINFHSRCVTCMSRLVSSATPCEWHGGDMALMR